MVLVLVFSAIVWKAKTKKETLTPKETTGVTNPDGKTLPLPPEPPKIPVPSEVITISGTVEKIKEKTLTMKVFFFGEQKTYTITVGDATKIQKREVKKEIPKHEEGKSFEPFTLTNASFSDIRQNDNLTIEASENIKDKSSFEAKTISINIVNLPDVSAPPSVSLPADLSPPPSMPALPETKDLSAPPSIPDTPKP